MSAIAFSSLNDLNSNGLSALSRSAAEQRAERENALEAADSAARAAADGKSTDAKLRGVAEEFVSVFMNQVMKSMRANVQENPEMHGDNGEKFFQQMLDGEYASMLSKGSGYGLTDLVYQALAAKTRVQPAEEAQTVEAEGMGEALAGVGETAL